MLPLMRYCQKGVPPRHPRASWHLARARALPRGASGGSLRCGARLLGSCASARLLGIGAAVRGAGRGRDTIRQAFGVCLAARALLHRACALVNRSLGLVAAGVGAHGALGSACAA
jgi:hypothetical protein